MYADTVFERLSAVIPGYDELPSNENGDEAAFVARYEAAIELANLVQTGLVIDATENDGWSPEQVTELSELGWIKLGERPGAELVFGVVSRPWEPAASVPAEPVTAEQFARFHEPGFAKIAESTRVDPYGERFSIVTVESRVALTDEDSRRRFRRYWLMLGPFMKLLRPTQMRT
jgi:hypothetical protein